MEQQEEELECYLLQLIERMNTKEEVCSSDESVSVQAYREAEKSGKLKDERVYPVLKKMILEHNRKKDKQFRREAYFIWGNLLQYIPQKEYIQFYLEQMEKDTDKYMVSAMLERIAEMEKIDMPKDLNIDVAIKLSKNEKWQIRHSAIRALRTFDMEESRQALRDYIGQTDEKNISMKLFMHILLLVKSV